MSLPQRLRHAVGSSARDLLGPWLSSQRSFAQEGEDLMLIRHFGNQRRGLYVDIGCHHPFRFSNTYLLYRMGWRGICVDPRPGTERLFRFWRPRDTVLEAGVGEAAGELVYHEFDEPALNTFDADIARSRMAIPRYKLLRTRMLRTLPLALVLDAHAPPATPIDLLSVDVEGLDLSVLRSNDWQRFRARVVVAEVLGVGLAEALTDPVSRFLEGHGYRPHAKTGNSVMYVVD